jgi:hypothetical protein
VLIEQIVAPGCGICTFALFKINSPKFGSIVKLFTPDPVESIITVAEPYKTFNVV